MVTVVVGARHSLVEKAPTLRDRAPICLVPEDVAGEWRDRGFASRVHTVSRWTDYTELVRVAGQLPQVSEVVALEELTIAAAGFLRSMLGVPGQLFGQAVAFTDKAVMKRRCAAQGIPVARWEVVHSFAEVPETAERLGWPVVLKPRRGFGSYSVVKVMSPEHFELLRATGTLDSREPDDTERAFESSGIFESLEDARDGFLVEEYVDVVAEFSCDITLWRDAERMVLTTRYLQPLLDAICPGGRIGVVTLPPNDMHARAVTDLARRAMVALDLESGQVHCEVFLTGAGAYVLGEIACRPGGGPIPGLVHLLFGVSSTDICASMSLGREPAAVGPPAYEALAVVAVPPRCGTVERVATIAELAAIPGFVYADVRVREGEQISDGTNSAAAAAYLYFTPTSLESVHAEHERVLRLSAEMFRFVAAPGLRGPNQHDSREI